MEIGNTESKEGAPSLRERKEEIYKAFLAGVQKLEQIDQIEQELRSAQEELGKLQAEAEQEDDTEFSVVSDVIGFDVSELSDAIKQYYQAKANVITADQYTNPSKLDNANATIEKLEKSLPSEVTSAVDTLVNKQFASEDVE